ncbi:MAG: glucose-6-phosphate dehydrogenase [Candidatus Pacebacteria bacterium]|nr:glucose-6-phosphate dehydrogenase [Candidatus Paceibacterota bacterium]
MTSASPQPSSPALHPTIFVIFGITGDLASRKLIPALLELYTKRLLPQRFAVIGFSRRVFSREEFREFIRERMNVKPGQFREEDIKHFLDHMSYEQGMFDDLGAYTRLSSKLKNIDDRWGQCSNKLFHLSVPPTLYEGVLTHISRSGLAEACDDGMGWTRILIEKPFGNDIETARSLDKLLGSLFKEQQIFRIDHYLAKEVLQNILAFRFSNSMFEPLWNRKYIDKVHIKLFEKNAVEGRGAFYDPMGAIKDVGQNHMLMMLAVIAMEAPKSLTAGGIRTERAKVLSRLKSVSPRTMSKQVVRGQYMGYMQESGVLPTSQTETYFRIQSFVNSARWKGVPFYLESGKALAESKVEIDVYFKQSQKSKVKSQNEAQENRQNILTFRIQPDEGIRVRFFVKVPGYDFNTEGKTLKFKYADSSFSDDIPNDYERLIRDAFVGDQTLFASTDEIMASWKYMMPILNNLKNIPLKLYEKGAEWVE